MLCDASAGHGECPGAGVHHVPHHHRGGVSEVRGDVRPGHHQPPGAGDCPPQDLQAVGPL